MSALLLDGRELSQQVRQELAVRVTELRVRGIVPKLVALVASQDPASLAYVRMKRKWAEQIGMHSESFPIDNQTTQYELLDLIRNLNADVTVHGVLIQHPLPQHLDELSALEMLGAEKDVDGITPQSLGRLLSDMKGFRCATPLGMMRLLERYSISVSGKHAVVIGRSLILGKPAALMLLQGNATVTIAHSKTTNLEDLCRTADILVAAVGRPEFVKAAWIKPGAVILDAGYNKVDGQDSDVGDVDFCAVRQIASAITPVPGGVGPMTVAMLLSNTVEAAEKSASC